MSEHRPKVRFRLKDTYLPDPAALLMERYGEQIVSGEEIGRSEGDDPSSTFVITHVDGFKDPLIVPLDRVIEVSQ